MREMSIFFHMGRLRPADAEAVAVGGVAVFDNLILYFEKDEDSSFTFGR